jgi:hypothetical protein
MKIAAAKAALLSNAIRKGRADFSLTGMRYSEEKIEEIKHSELTGEFAKLKRLKNTNPEAYYYWLLSERLE